MKLKRLFDILFSLGAILFLWPLMAFIALIILLDDGSPVIFKQDRVGLGNKDFQVKKFRTMKNGTRHAPTRDLKEANEVITKSGRFIRKASLDELPQLFNILEGTMSFVGPRPLIRNEPGIHELRNALGVYTVRPGMTGLAQINGRDMITHEEKVKYDKEYVDHMSLRNDLKIIIRTFKTVLKGENIAEGSDTNQKKTV